MTILSHGLTSVLRSRRRTLSAILGVTLTVAFVAGTFIAIDSSARSLLEATLRAQPGDFAVRGVAGDLEEAAADLRSVPGVAEARPYALLRSLEMVAAVEGGTVHTGPDGLALDPARPPAAITNLSLQLGTLDPPRGSVVLSGELARALRVGPGDTVTLQVPRRTADPPTNTSLQVAGVATLSQEGIPFQYWLFRTSHVFLIHLEDLDWLRDQLDSPDVERAVEVHIERGRFVNPYDLAASRERVVRFERTLAEVAAAHGGTVENRLLPVLATFEAAIVNQRILYLMLSLPVVLLGLYLGSVGVELGQRERRRELALLKTRGAGRPQLGGLLALEAILGGLLAAALGLVGGVALSRLLLSVVNPLATEVAVQYADLFVSPTTVVLTVVLSVLFMGIVSYRSAKRTADLPVAESLRDQAPGEGEMAYRPTADVVLVTLAATAYGMVLYAQRAPGGFLLFLVGGIFFVLLPFAPLFLVVGGTRLLTRSTGRVYEAAARLLRPLARNLAHIIHRNLARDPRRSSNVAVIIALGLAFGTFILVMNGSQMAYQAEELRARVGADVALRIASVDPTLEKDLLDLEGVVAVTPAEELSTRPAYCCADVFALDPETYLAAVQPRPWALEGLGAERFETVLETEGQVVASESYAREAFLEIGDPLELGGPVFNASSGAYEEGRLQVTVGGIVRGLPGLAYRIGPGPDALYGSFATLAPFVGGADGPFGVERRYFLDLAPEAPWREVKASVEALGAYQVEVFQEQLEWSTASPTARAILGFIDMELAFVGVILTAGLALIVYAASLERRQELAAILARGSSRRQMAGLLLGEGLAILLIGVAVGVGVGLLAAFLTSEAFLVGPLGGATRERFVPFSYVIPPQAPLLVGATALAMALAVLLIAWGVSRLNLARVLKIRGG